MAMELCCVCLETKYSCKTVTKVDESNVKLVTKLQYIAPEVEWLEDYLICGNCISQLNDVCKFKALCLSHSLRKDLKYEIKENVEYNEDIGNGNSDTERSSDKDEQNQDVEVQGGIQGIFICYDCGEKCITKNGLVEHIKNEHEAQKFTPNHHLTDSSDGQGGIYKSREFECIKCKRKYAQEATLKQHLTSCDGIRRHVKTKSEYQCNRCKKYYTTRKILNAHKKRCDYEVEDRKTNFQCPECNKYYISLKTLKVHYKRGCKKDDGSNVVFCKICDEYFKSVLLLKHHMQSEHKISDYHCNICVINFDTSEEYELHNTTNHADKKLVTNKRSGGRVASRKFKCEVCNEEFNLLKTVVEHCINVHSMEEKLIRPYSCAKCDNRFRSSTNLLNHMLYHDRNRTCICSFCGKSFITKNDLTSHEYIHLNHRNYKCDKCEKAFKTNTNLRTHHLIVHTDPALWKYTCQICNKRFPQKSNHDQHLRRHIGEKNFICPLCKKGFTSKSEMQEHVTYHSNVRAYKCESCGKEYRKKYTYNLHLTKIHGLGNAKIPVREKKHACHICPSRFYDRLKLARHLCTHSGLKPYACYVCQKKFTDKSYLKHHLKTTHNIIGECKYE